MNKIDITRLEIVKQDKKRAWAFCLAHKDTRKPNLCITLTEDYYGSYYCFACGYAGRFSVADMGVLQLKKQKRTQPINIDWRKLTLDYFYNSTTQREIRGNMERLCKQWGVFRASSDDFLIGWDGEAFTAPMYDADFNIIGIHRRFPDGSKCCVEGSQLGLFIPCGYKQRIQEPLFICEGLSDTVSVYDLGFFAVGKPNCNIGDNYIVNFISQNKIKHVVIIPDNDTVGYSGAMGLKLQLQHSDYLVYSETIFQYDVRAKDIREFIDIVGKSRVQKELEECLR